MRERQPKGSWMNTLKIVLLLVLLVLWILFARAFTVLWGTVLFVQYVLAPLGLLYVAYLVLQALRRAAGRK